MNGIRFADYKEFPEKWSLVTVRYRKDTGEMRLTYGNELAMKTLLSGSINYPDGSVFAKTGIHTGVDPDFVSSVVPKGIRRYQLMVKDRKKYASTNGWGYGLFDPEGKTFPEDPKATQDACFACHTIVENRGDVFSQYFAFNKKPGSVVSQPQALNTQPRLKFTAVALAKLPEDVRKVLPNIKQIRIVNHDRLQKHVFQGTLDEMKPILEHESRKDNSPVGFFSADFKKYVLIIPGKSQECMDLRSYQVVSTDVNLKQVVDRYCAHD